MSRLRRLLVEEKIFFVTCNLSPTRLAFTEIDYAFMGAAFQGVRERRRFLLTGYVFMPDHWHALMVPGEGDTLPLLMDALKVSMMRRVNSRRCRRGPLWQPRYFDEVIFRVKQYHDTLQYIHFNPVTQGLVSKPEDWAWSSYRCYGGSGELPLPIDHLDLPTNKNERL